jgi:hypothetical protein
MRRLVRFLERISVRSIAHKLPEDLIGENRHLANPLRVSSAEAKARNGRLSLVRFLEGRRKIRPPGRLQAEACAT